MSNDVDTLPLFKWKQPDCRLIPFPMVNRIGRIRDTAAKMIDKPTEKSAEHYRRQVDEAMTTQFSKIGLSGEKSRSNAPRSGKRLTLRWRVKRMDGGTSQTARPRYKHAG